MVSSFPIFFLDVALLSLIISGSFSGFFPDPAILIFHGSKSNYERVSSYSAVTVIVFWGWNMISISTLDFPGTSPLSGVT